MLQDIFHAKAQRENEQRRKILNFNTLRFCEIFAPLHGTKGIRQCNPGQK